MECVKGVVKHYRTCKFCRGRTTQQKKTAKKRRPLELEESEDHDNVDFLEVLELNELPDYLAQLFEVYTTQSDAGLKFYFKCAVNISIFDKTTKKIAGDIVEIIEDIDEFAWMYVSFVLSYQI